METKTSRKRYLTLKIKKSIKLDSSILIENEHDKSLKW